MPDAFPMVLHRAASQRQAGEITMRVLRTKSASPGASTAGAKLALGALSIGLAACSAAAPQPAASQSLNGPSSSRAAPATASAEARTPNVVELPALQAYFAEARATGAIALYDSAKGKLECSDLTLCDRAVLPASTFKIPSALIAIEDQVVEDSETLLRWDGQPRSVPEWNQDQTLRAAIRVSCVPCFQRIARSIGPERMQDWVTRFGYGNHDTRGGIDRFWLTGELRISPLQQIDFLRRLEGGKLPVSARTSEIVLDMLALDVGREHVLRGKTGLTRPPESQTLVGWFVGWVELAERRVFFATLIDGVAPDVDVVPLRRRLTEHILHAQGALPDEGRAPPPAISGGGTHSP